MIPIEIPHVIIPVQILVFSDYLLFDNKVLEALLKPKDINIKANVINESVRIVAVLFRKLSSTFDFESATKIHFQVAPFLLIVRISVKYIDHSTVLMLFLQPES